MSITSKNMNVEKNTPATPLVNMYGRNMQEFELLLKEQIFSQRNSDSLLTHFGNILVEDTVDGYVNWNDEIEYLLLYTPFHIPNVSPQRQQDGSYRFMAVVYMRLPGKSSHSKQFSVGTYMTATEAILALETAREHIRRYRSGAFSFEELRSLFSVMCKMARPTEFRKGYEAALHDLLSSFEDSSESEAISHVVDSLRNNLLYKGVA